MKSRPLILVVEDEPAIRRLICRALELNGYVAREAGGAVEALRAMRASPPDLVLLDLGLPDRDGMELLPLFREGGAAVLVLTARGESAEKVAALDSGADDYVTKPFDTDELLARVRTCLRHRQAVLGQTDRLTVGDVSIDMDMRRVSKGLEEVHLTPKEYDVLAELARHAGRLLTHAHLLRAVWGPSHQDDVEYLRVAVRALRRKLESDPAAPVLIRNEPGVGYRLVA
ncbi:MAG TPA: response regulator transcription factor [Allosphingosinicella sp.]